MGIEETTGVYRFDYEMDKSTWTAFVVAQSSDDAIQHLNWSLDGKVVQLRTTGFECRIDSISKSIVDDIVAPYKAKIDKLVKSKEALKMKKPAAKKKAAKPKEAESITIGKK
jgi:hypothetical protein